jgi:DNA mismatch repair protein MSH3
LSFCRNSIRRTNHSGELLPPLPPSRAVSQNIYVLLSGHDLCHLDQPFNDVIGFPKPVVVALAHAVRYLISYGLSDAFKRTTFFTTFLTRSHMLLNANTLENLYVCALVNHLSLRHCFREIFQNQTDYTRIGSLIWILDRTLTRFGARQLRQWVSRPLVNQRRVHRNRGL